MRHTIAMRPDHTGAIPTASSATIEQYTKAGQSLLRQCARDLGVKVPTLRPAQFIDWFVRQHGRWSDNTIRVYRRAAETYLHAMWMRQVLSPDELCRLRRALSSRYVRTREADGRELSDIEGRHATTEAKWNLTFDG